SCSNTTATEHRIAMVAHHLHWSHGQATVLTTAAMLADCSFVLPSGNFSPFARAPWMGSIDDPEILGHLRELGGDFVCLPFGVGREVRNPPPDWKPLLTGVTSGRIHGPAADEEWVVLDANDTAITLWLHYPETSPVLRVERTIATHDGEPTLDCTFRIFARRSAAISVGLHPILRLPDKPGRLRIDADFAFGLTHPGYGGAEFSQLDAVRNLSGVVDLGHVPLLSRADLNVQLCGMFGPLRATYLDESAGLEIDWDRSLLPSLQIWHTDGGIGGAPWHNIFRGIGLEPVASAFDLDSTVSCAPNPINARGVATAIQLDPVTPVTIRHTFRAFTA
ncbi:MAG: hypothetical protein ABJA10_01475, partial [Aestuariivirga sp.]